MMPAAPSPEVAVPNASKNKKPPMLVKWRFVPSKKGSAGEARYWWSDGTKSEEKVASLVEAVLKLKVIQDNGGERELPGDP
jgi:hypothetical protein